MQKSYCWYSTTSGDKIYQDCTQACTWRHCYAQVDALHASALLLYMHLDGKKNMSLTLLKHLRARDTNTSIEGVTRNRGPFTESP